MVGATVLTNTMTLGADRAPRRRSLRPSRTGALLRAKLLEQPALLGIERDPLEQVRPAQPGAAERLLPAPGANARVVSRQQHFRHRPPLVHLRTGVVRIVEQPARERVLGRGILVP